MPRQADVNQTGDMPRSVAIFSHVRDFAAFVEIIRSDIVSLFMEVYLKSLFGLKTKLQFGKTNITAVFSQQNSESTTVTAEGGAEIQEFELRATDYDNDRHFFLSQYFRENYSKSLQNYPLISSPINITRIELWITNRNASVEDFRSIVALADIAEPNSENFVSLDGLVIPALTAPTVNGVALPSNESNNISGALSGPQIRD